MDNYNSNGSGIGEDLFGFIPPNMMYPQHAFTDDTFSSKEEMERYFYHLEHDDEFHLKNCTPED
ncbi:MAG: hypothetical protein J5981_04140 [Lachnospira sp.]|nr:hypothetical protein [Lachnospira sp.]